MKNKVIVLLMLCLMANLSPSALLAEDIVINAPAFSACAEKEIDLDKIVLSDSFTELTFTCYFADNKGGFALSPSAMLVAGESIFKMREASIPTSILHKKGEGGVGESLTFTVTYPPLPANTPKIDFLESFEDKGVRIWGIELKSKTITDRAEVPADIRERAKVKSDSEGLEVPVFDNGTAIVRGKIYGYLPAMKYQVFVIASSPLSGQMRFPQINVDKEGMFTVEMQLPNTQGIYVLTAGGWYPVVVTPGEVTDMYIDLQRQCATTSRIRTDMEKDKNYIFFTGANADINNQANDVKMIDPITSHLFWNTLFNIKDDKVLLAMSPQDYKAEILKRLNGYIKYVEKNSINRKGQEFLELCLKQSALVSLMSINSIYTAAYNRTQGNSFSNQSEGAPKLKLDLDYFSFIKDFGINDRLWLYNPGSISSFALAGLNIEDGKTESPSPNENLSAFLGVKLPMLESVLKTNKGMLFDWWTIQRIMQNMRNNGLTEQNISDLEGLSDPFYLEHMRNLESAWRSAGIIKE